MEYDENKGNEWKLNKQTFYVDYCAMVKHTEGEETDIEESVETLNVTCDLLVCKLWKSYRETREMLFSLRSIEHSQGIHYAL